MATGTARRCTRTSLRVSYTISALRQSPCLAPSGFLSSTLHHDLASRFLPSTASSSCSRSRCCASRTRGTRCGALTRPPRVHAAASTIAQPALTQRCPYPGEFVQVWHLPWGTSYRLSATHALCAHGRGAREARRVRRPATCLLLGPRTRRAARTGMCTRWLLRADCHVLLARVCTGSSHHGRRRTGSWRARGVSSSRAPTPSSLRCSGTFTSLSPSFQAPSSSLVTIQTASCIPGTFTTASFLP